MQDENCIFCRIAKKEIPATIIFENEKVLAFLDIRPRNPGHTLVIPKDHSETIFEISEDDIAEVYKVVRKLSVAAKKAVNADGVNIIQSNIVSQGVRHFHTHVIPRFFADGMPIVWESHVEASKEELGEVAGKIKSELK